MARQKGDTSVSGKGYLVMSQICYLKNALYDFDKNVVSDEVVCAGLNALTPVTFFIWSFSQIALENGHFTRTASKTPNPETLIALRTRACRSRIFDVCMSDVASAARLSSMCVCSVLAKVVLLRLWHWHSPCLAVVVSLCFLISLSFRISLSISHMLFCIVSLRTRWEVEQGQLQVEELSGAIADEASRLRLQYSCIIFSDLPGIHISRPACARACAKGTV